MHKYEAMFIVKPDLSEDEKKALFQQVNDTVTKSAGIVSQALVWSEKRNLYFPIKKYREGIYYLMNFSLAPEGILKIEHTYKLNENILRVLITRVN